MLHGSYGERVKRPVPKVLDADGVSIKVGDTVWAAYGERRKHVVKAVCSDGSLHPNLLTVDGCMVDYEDGGWDLAKRVTHKPPDSWEKLEEDVNLGCRDYCEKHRLEECDCNMRVHILARAKKLAKAGE